MTSCGQGGCSCFYFSCSESRSWVQWPVTQSHPDFPLCDDYAYGTVANGLVPSYASRVAYEDAEASAAGTIDHDNLPVVFALQRMIDSLKIITSGQPDLAATDQLIHLGSNPSLCLSAKWNAFPKGNCASVKASQSWSYDRATGRISPMDGLCVAALGPTTQGLVALVPCTDDDSDELQTWDWNPDTGIIKNSRDAVLTTSGSIPQAGSSVSVPGGENSWYRHRQIWANGVSPTCTGGICAAPGTAAWNQGTIGKTTQRYPMDFSIFSYLQARNLNDVRGPVAVHGGGPYDYVNSFYSPSYPPSMTGGLYAASFLINGDSKMPVPLVAGVGDLALWWGTLFGTSNKVSGGTTYYGPYRTATVDSTVTPSFKDTGHWVKTESDTNPIDFQMAIEKLQGMSTALSKYAKSGTVTCYQNGPSYCNFIMSYTGNANPVVFAVTGADLAKASSIQFNVPAGRTVLINVSGTSVKIQNAGFKFGNIQGSSTLWNLYEAPYFETDSVTVPGSVLAPLATTMLRYGAMNGTLVAWSLDTSSEEFHWYPFHNNALVTSP